MGHKRQISQVEEFQMTNSKDTLTKSRRLHDSPLLQTMEAVHVTSSKKSREENSHLCRNPATMTKTPAK